MEVRLVLAQHHLVLISIRIKTATATEARRGIAQSIQLFEPLSPPLNPLYLSRQSLSSESPLQASINSH